MVPNSISSSPSQSEGNSGRYNGAFAIMTVLFFTWGFMTVFNDILIPRFKEAFTLTYFGVMLVQSAFFGAYFIGSLIYFAISVIAGDPIAKMGYKNGVVLGLLISAVGSGLFWPAAVAASYNMFLVALFIVGMGFAMLQIAANPYVTLLGPESTASSRLNLAQAFNSAGTTFGPLIGGYLIFQYLSTSHVQGADSVKVPYLVFCLIFLFLALVFSLIHLPHVGEGKIEPGFGALKYPHVVLGILAIFMYVGGEVSVGSSIINFLGDKGIAGLSNVEASKYVSMFWGGLLIGRFMGAAELSDLRFVQKQALLVLIPVVAIFALWLIQSVPLDAMRSGPIADLPRLWADQCIANSTMFRNYLPAMVLCWALFQAGRGSAGRTLLIFSLTVSVLLIGAMIFGGTIAMWCVVSIGLFSSIGWSNIFSLALDGLGTLKSQASSLLVMAVVGGAILPPLQGKIADFTGHIQYSFIVPCLAYGYVAFYGWYGTLANKKQAPAVVEV